MSTAPEALSDQAHRLVRAARWLPADEAITVLEQVATIVQAAQAEVLASAERSGDLADSGCRTARSFAATILRRSAADASAVAQVALHLDAFPRLAEAYRAGLVHTGNLRTILRGSIAPRLREWPRPSGGRAAAGVVGHSRNLGAKSGSAEAGPHHRGVGVVAGVSHWPPSRTRRSVAAKASGSPCWPNSPPRKPA